ncbi:hypothetical protein P3T39_003636 [Kitasatospora sp. GP82]|nr:hypothetical protein [Kitasatospora sp. GP82]
MWQPVLDAYRDRIVESGRQPLFLLLLGLIGSFLFIRFGVRMIRRGTSWWPGNVTPGGLHIHHVVLLRLSRSVLRFLSRWWQLESLYRANAKYQPVWEPRFLLYEKSSELPAIALANALAEGFLTWPRLRTAPRP